jgi:hypothetical protein
MSGHEVAHDLEITFDGERIHPVRFGGADDEAANYLNPTAAAATQTRFRLRIPVKAGPHARRGVLEESSAPTVELLQPFLRERIDPITPVSIPEVDKVTIEARSTSPAREIAEPAADLRAGRLELRSQLVPARACRAPIA